MNKTDTADDSVLSHFHAPSWWGLAGGALLGLGIAIFAAITSPLWFTAAVIGGAGVGVVFGHTMDQLLETQDIEVSNVSHRSKDGAAIEQSVELNDHLKLREQMQKRELLVEKLERDQSNRRPAILPQTQAGASFQDRAGVAAGGSIRR